MLTVSDKLAREAVEAIIWELSTRYAPGGPPTLEAAAARMLRSLLDAPGVPREPTEKMLFAAGRTREDFIDRGDGDVANLDDNQWVAMTIEQWQAMYDAAPSAAESATPPKPVETCMHHKTAEQDCDECEAIFVASGLKSALLDDPAIAPDARSQRDIEWVRAMAAALGTDSNYMVPIIPEPGPFRELFASIRTAAMRAATGLSAEGVAEFRQCRDDLGDARRENAAKDERLREAERDAARWHQARSQPEGMSHLLRLLAEKKGTPAKLDEMVDKIIMQRAAQGKP